MSLFERQTLPPAPFWMVYGVGQGAPTHQHATAEDAAREAKRLARLHRGSAFVVLKAMGAAICDDLHTISFHAPKSAPDLEDEISF